MLVDSMKTKIDFYGSAYEKLLDIVPSYHSYSTLDELCGSCNWVAQQIIEEEKRCKQTKLIYSETSTILGSETSFSMEAEDDESIAQHLIRLSTHSFRIENPCEEEIIQDIVSDFIISEEDAVFNP